MRSNQVGRSLSLRVHQDKQYLVILSDSRRQGVQLLINPVQRGTEISPRSIALCLQETKDSEFLRCVYQLRNVTTILRAGIA
jgi:hypothetical protein